MTERINQNPMGSRPVLPLLVSMSLPPILSMLIQSLYNVVDSIFVARLSSDALTAVSLAYPLQNLVLAVAVGFGVGANAFVARSLGQGDQRSVDKAASMGMVFTGIHALAFLLIGLFGSEPFLRLFTTDEQVLAMSLVYTRIVICLAFGSLFHIYIEKLLQSVGNMFVPMILQGVGAIVNIVLDPILIFGLLGAPRMGVAGAAVATVAGQMTACAMALVYFFRAKTGMHITRKDMKADWNIAGKIYGVGVPSCLMTALPSLLVGVLNALLVELHALAVAVFGLYFKLQTFVYMPANGLIQGMRPIVSYNYGARQKQRMHSAIRWSLTLTAVIMALGTLIAWVLPEQIMALFDADSAMVAIGVPMLRITSLGFVVSTFGTVLAGCFEALGKGVQSLAVSLIRQLVVIPPLAMVLSRFWELNGVWVSFPVAETLAARGALVTVVEMGQTIGAGLNKNRMVFVRRRLEEGHVTLLTQTRVVSVALPELTVEDQNGLRTLTGFDAVVVAAGRKPENQLAAAARQELPELPVYLVGDANQPGMAMDAVTGGALLAASL